jgi:uncharacterized protein YutE (UPF0331/DUF86 family)
MAKEINKELLKEQLTILDAAAEVLTDSHTRVKAIFTTNKEVLSIEQKESCEALTSRFARLCDFIFQRAFRTLDVLELQDEGSGIDRLNRMEKRGVIESTHSWKELRELRNEIAHEYLIEKSDRVLKEAFKQTPQLIETVKNIKKYIQDKKLL